jgi:hypothetical protein
VSALITMSASPAMLAQVKLEDFFKSTQQSIGQEPDSSKLVPLLLCAAAMIVLLAVLHYRRRRQAVPRTVNNHGRLIKEIAKKLPLKPGEIKALSQMADEQSCSNPLVLVLCPSLLAKGLANKPEAERQALTPLIGRMTGREEKR